MAGVQRVRVEFVEEVATDVMVEWGFSRVVVSIDESMKHVSDLLHGIVRRFGLSNRGYDLLLGDFAILPSEKIERILQTDDVLSLRASSAHPARLLVTSSKVDKKHGKKQKRPREKVKVAPAVAAPAKSKVKRHNECESKRTIELPKVAASKKTETSRSVHASGVIKKRTCSSESSGRERRRKRSRKVDTVEMAISPPVQPHIAPSVATPPRQMRKGHVRFDEVESAQEKQVKPTNAVTTFEAPMTRGSSTAPTEKSTSSVLRASRPRAIPVKLQKYGPRQGATRRGFAPAPPLPVSGRIVDENVRSQPVQPPAPSAKNGPSSVVDPVKLPKPTVHLDSSNEVWKRPYTVIASVKHDGGSSKAKDTHKDFNMDSYPVKDMSAIVENDVIAFKTITLCQVRFEPIVSEWKVGKVLSHTANDVSVQLCRHVYVESDIAWQPDDEVCAFNVVDFAEIRVIKTSTAKIPVDVSVGEQVEPDVEEDDAQDLLEALRRRKEELLVKASL
ncbi:hypothetical protein H310_13059 [Aphanomyces invadans]|uniref:Coilin n=1 Tax=Aphanomyces invadans TaxID=157072 RepID=A0A024TF12_9STRA|nr:hypothetical protein H310_13059 [Aphanomyces invadans]ETV92604.1 hypothetical protein H310_13059 [Aphanomyces invadans]|eukprot:XP_008878640.1 hypothetical protein H310_13059 [Aphanomyces invadans]